MAFSIRSPTDPTELIFAVDALHVVATIDFLYLCSALRAELEVNLL
jgi:hypothetical protein